ncbi:uncharacterized protein GGS22DRAFT_69300 [Annulohypoxylon maeteangense]|uniref:uncharacterized protein n=1 Tax=Annulohypoxylon maeteangense TaxID=1927788 RepID=UPI002007CA77|nr:uncharacterized protein GGS22DRAFT_69300 [Annulohypoxylon maeteangense]KAI0889262.1 hypothetical protein GGS22DRAFT_69300 [Annulohypoxylon maeteangense]
MAGFAKTLIVAIVVCIVVVVIVTGLLIYIALNWSKILRRVTPDRWASPPSEKSTWPEPRPSGEFVPSPISSTRSSRFSADPMMTKFTEGQGESITPPPNVKA